MTYALIVDGYVTNIIWLHPMNADEFPNAVSTNGLPVQIGDTYTGGKFYRNGEEITLPDNTYTLDEVAELLASEVNA